MKQFIFEQNNKKNWQNITMNMKSEFYLLQDKCSQDFSVVIDKYSPKRSSKQLRSYWVLIDICKDYMNEQGNNFDEKEVSNYFKIKAGHYNLVEGVRFPRSISNKSNTTRDEMRHIIECIMEFGRDNNIEGCYIQTPQLEEILNNFKTK